MARGNGGSKGGGKPGGRPVPIPPNNGPNSAGWPSTTGKPSGDDRNNGPQKG